MQILTHRNLSWMYEYNDLSQKRKPLHAYRPVYGKLEEGYKPHSNSGIHIPVIWMPAQHQDP